MNPLHLADIPGAEARTYNIRYYDSLTWLHDGCQSMSQEVVIKLDLNTTTGFPTESGLALKQNDCWSYRRGALEIADEVVAEGALLRRRVVLKPCIFVWFPDKALCAL